MTKPIKILAHRGAARTGPENTLEALKRCRAEGADAVELDVRLCADGEPVVFHDEDARRLAGVGARIRDLPWREVRELRVFGRWPVPHLDQALEEVERWPRAELYLDLHERRAELAWAAAERLDAAGMLERSYVLAFYSDRGLLRSAREACPDVRLAVMPGPPWNIAASHALGARALCLGWDGPLTRTLYRLASRLWDVRSATAAPVAAGCVVSAGIANTPEDVAWLAGQGFTALWSDDLVMARRAAAELGRAEPLASPAP